MPGRFNDPSVQMSLPRPGKVLKVVMLGLFAIWLCFALALNWGGASRELFALFCGSTDRILRGDVWRLFTAPLMHQAWGSPWPIMQTLLGLYFLAPSLEEQFGARRFARFLGLSAVFAYVFQILVESLLPASIAGKLVGEYWYGATPVVLAIAIAWALNFKGQTVNLMFVLPVSSRTFTIFVVAMCVLSVIVGAQAESGLIAPFGGMLCGWLLGGGTPSPLRRWYLKYRLGHLDREAERARNQRRKRAAGSNLRVIPGGLKAEPESDPDQSPAPRTNGKSAARGPDGKLLN